MLKRMKIKTNRIRCKRCGDIIESVSVHDSVWCSCGSCNVDGGRLYLKRSFLGEEPCFEELSEYEKENENEL